MAIDKASLLKAMAPLLTLKGSWTGTGTGSFPTLEPFKYREKTDFRTIQGEPYIEFSQMAWLLKNEDENLIHWETGIISAVSEDQLKWYACHMNGRIEVYTGAFNHRSEENEIIFKSEFIRNEKGLKTAIAAFRALKFNNRTLEYTMKMSTSEVKLLESHLAAKLLKVKPEN